ncbi:shikimate kinase [Natranaerofaba carboxydovora]|uniref:shikimate kinase n=1 Tax=Natranaerofaba carboxydovora TaxID=2742683 RepID=UPI001F13CEFC|nr:shikimate kinase [Natranaerofaba carboxydovora]UMZ73977.1 Shikimate kinase [Natranaerofaba carboxydovora]
MNKNLVLMGFMGTGKTVVGERLSKKLELPLYDTDNLIEQKAGKSIPNIFDEYGEVYFRELETEVLKEIISFRGCVISTGGGVVLKDKNWDILKSNENMFLISLMAKPETIYERLENDTARPLLQVEDPYEKICELFDKRKELYLRADIVLWTDDLAVEEIVEKVIDKVSL